MGAFERGKKTNRLHFHAIVYVPDGSMPGKLRNEKSWDNDNHKIIDVVVNESFEKKIGRNDFKEISKFDNTFDRAIEYVIKYISKSNDKIVFILFLFCCFLMFSKDMKNKKREAIKLPFF